MQHLRQADAQLHILRNSWQRVHTCIDTEGTGQAGACPVATSVALPGLQFPAWQLAFISALAGRKGCPAATHSTSNCTAGFGSCAAAAARMTASCPWRTDAAVMCSCGSRCCIGGTRSGEPPRHVCLQPRAGRPGPCAPAACRLPPGRTPARLPVQHLPWTAWGTPAQDGRHLSWLSHGQPSRASALLLLLLCMQMLHLGVHRIQLPPMPASLTPCVPESGAGSQTGGLSG